MFKRSPYQVQKAKSVEDGTDCFAVRDTTDGHLVAETDTKPQARTEINRLRRAIKANPNR